MSALNGTRVAGAVGGLLRLRLERLRELSLMAIIVVAALGFSLVLDDYLTGSFFNPVATSVAILAVLAAAQTIVILTRNIDLSVGSVVGVTAYVTGEYLAANQGTSRVLAVGLAVAMGCGLGVINGVLVAFARIPAIIVTLGTLAIYRTWLIDHAEARTITADSLPRWVIELPQKPLFSIGTFDVEASFAAALLLALLLQVMLGTLSWGRWLYAVGSNPDAARQAGLPVSAVTLGAFVASGALAGLAGFMFLARFGTITVAAGQGLELASVAAAVVGGISIFGGSGTIVGALLGAVLITLLDLSLVRVPQVSQFWQDAILAALILAAVAADSTVGQRVRELSARRVQRRTGFAPPSPGTTADA